MIVATMSKCHPNRKLQARQMCKPCYDKWLKINNPSYRQRQIDNTNNWISKNKEHFQNKNHERWIKRKSDPHFKRIRRSQTLYKKYGITADEYDQMLIKQNNCCALCFRSPGDFPLHVDHIHGTKIIRGLLCHQCNWYMGTVDYDPSIIQRIEKYRCPEIKNEMNLNTSELKIESLKND